MKMLLIILLLGSQLTVQAKDLGKIVDELTIPLSSPDQRGLLQVNQIYGSLNVTGYSGKEVQVVIRQKQKKYKLEKKNGLTKISNQSFNIDVEEIDNKVKVSSTPYGRGQPVNLEIKVPYNFDLRLKSVNDGNTFVEGVSGELEVSNVNGNITLQSISGLASADSSNGFVKVSFDAITPDANMAFSSVNQDVDISLPASTKATIKSKTIGGEILTGFDMVLEKNAIEVEKKRSGGKYKLGFEQWVKGKINGGGSEFLLSSVNGDIIIRSIDE